MQRSLTCDIPLSYKPESMDFESAAESAAKITPVKYQKCKKYKAVQS